MLQLLALQYDSVYQKVDKCCSDDIKCNSSISCGMWNVAIHTSCLLDCCCQCCSLNWLQYLSNDGTWFSGGILDNHIRVVTCMLPCWGICNWEHDLWSSEVMLNYLIVAFWSSRLLNLQSDSHASLVLLILDFCCSEITLISWLTLKWDVDYIHASTLILIANTCTGDM